VGGVLSILAVAALPATAALKVTHKQVQEIKVTGQGGATLQSIARTSDGRIAALIGPPRYGGVAGSKADPKAAIGLYDERGSRVAEWPIDFVGQAIGATPDGGLLVGGSGKIALYSAKGQLIRKLDLPYITELISDKDALRKKAEAQIESQKDSVKQLKEAYAQQIKVLKEQIEKLNANKKDGELSAADTRKVARLKSQLTSYESVTLNDAFGPSNVDAVIEGLVQRAATINAVSAGENEVFVVSGESQGYGFGVWRLDSEFKNPSKIISNLRGCCGQMDVQVCQDGLIVAQNTNHNVGRFDRTGKELSHFGKRSSLFSADGFGGCCNPMNVCTDGDGNVYTAESEGIIRRFGPDGKSLGLVGRVNLTGGCKNVAIAVTPKADKIFFCDLPGSRIIVLGPVANDAEGESLAREAAEKAKAQEAAEIADDADEEEDAAPAKK
jgi:hypothetical protein